MVREGRAECVVRSQGVERCRQRRHEALERREVAVERGRDEGREREVIPAGQDPGRVHSASVLAAHLDV